MELDSNNNMFDLNSATQSFKLSSISKNTFIDHNATAKPSSGNNRAPTSNGVLGVTLVLAVIGITIAGTKGDVFSLALNLAAHLLVVLSGASCQPTNQGKSAKCVEELEHLTSTSRRPHRSVKPQPSKKSSRYDDADYRAFVDKMDAEFNKATVEQGTDQTDQPWSAPTRRHRMTKPAHRTIDSLDDFRLNDEEELDFYDGWEDDNFDWESLERSAPPAGRPMEGPHIGNSPSEFLRLPMAQVAPKMYLPGEGYIEPRSVWPDESRFFMDWK